MMSYYPKPSSLFLRILSWMKPESDPKDGFWFHVFMIFSSTWDLRWCSQMRFTFLRWAEITNSQKWWKVEYFKVYKGWYILHMDFPNKTRHHFDPDRPLAHQCLSRSRLMPFAPSNDEGSKSRSFHPEGMERIWRGSGSSGPWWP